MKKAIKIICVVFVVSILTVPIYADKVVNLDNKLQIEVKNTLDTGNGKVRVSSWPWLPLLQFDRYRSLFDASER